jgi:hypothetical protein
MVAPSLVAFGLALASKESAVLAPILAVGLTLVAPGGTPGPDLRRSVRRVGCWLPQLVLVAAYLASYKALALGEMRNLAYVDPLSQPLAFLRHGVLHLPVLWLAGLSPAPPSLTMFYPSTLLPMAIAGAATFLVWLVLSWPLLRQPLLAWALAAWLLALLPQVGTDASGGPLRPSHPRRDDRRMPDGWCVHLDANRTRP